MPVFGVLLLLCVHYVLAVLQSPTSGLLRLHVLFPIESMFQLLPVASLCCIRLIVSHLFLGLVYCMYRMSPSDRFPSFLFLALYISLSSEHSLYVLLWRTSVLHFLRVPTVDLSVCSLVSSLPSRPRLSSVLLLSSCLPLLLSLSSMSQEPRESEGGYINEQCEIT